MLGYAHAPGRKRMPFDGTDFPREDRPPGRGTPDGNAATWIIVLLAFCLLVMPVSLTGLVDIIRYMRGN